MKNKGFTLIELLAIIIILAIIGVITVPIILGIIDDAKKGAAKDSAYRYIDAIDNYYYSNSFNNPSFNIEGSKYKIDNNGYLVSNDETIIHEISFSGTIPNQGLIDINSEGIINGCIVINNYRFLIVDSTLSDDIKKGDNCKESFTITFNTNGGNEIQSITAKEGSKIDLPTPTKTKDDFTYTFDGWFKDDGTEATNIVPGYNTTYYAHYKDLGAKFISELPTKIKTLSNNNLKNLHKFLKAETIDAEHKIDSNKVSATNSEPIYMWFEDNNLYWYSLDDSPGFDGITLKDLFRSASNLTDISGLTGWDTSNVTNMSYMFYIATNLTDISPLKDWNTSNVTNMSYMFYNTTNLTDISPLKDWNTEKVTNMNCMFSNTTNLTDISPLKDWNTSNVANMSYMFSNTTNLTDISPLKDWNTNSVTNMSNMFSGAKNLTDISPLKDWNTNSVTSMSSMFSGATNLTDISPLKNWNTSNVTNMSSMFNSATNLTDISPLKDWNTSNVTNMSNMFKITTNLTDINSLKDWNTSNVTNMSNMFSGAKNLTDISPLKDWNTSNVTNMSYMFSSATNLTDISPLKDWNTSNVTNMSYMFSETNKLTDTSMIKWITKSVPSNKYYKIFYRSGVKAPNYPTFYSDDEKTQIINGTWDSNGTFTPSS